VARKHPALGNNLTPLGEGSGAIEPETLAAEEMSFLVIEKCWVV
jgi:hypothetical protein